MTSLTDLLPSATPVDLGFYAKGPAGGSSLISVGGRSYLKSGYTALASAYPNVPAAFVSAGWQDLVTSSINPSPGGSGYTSLFCADGTNPGNIICRDVGANNNTAYSSFYPTTTTYPSTVTTAGYVRANAMDSGGGMTIAVGWDAGPMGTNSYTVYAEYTANGTNWGSIFLGQYYYWTQVRYIGNNKFVALGYDTGQATETYTVQLTWTGSAWNTASVSGGENINYSVRPEADLAGTVLIGSATGAHYMISTNYGASYTVITGAPTTFTWFAYSGGTWLAGVGANIYRTTTPGVASSWTAITNPLGTAAIAYVVAANGYFFLYQQSGTPTMYVSPDTLTGWTKSGVAPLGLPGSLGQGSQPPVWTGDRLITGRTNNTNGSGFYQYASTPKNYVLNSTAITSGVEQDYMRVA